MTRAREYTVGELRKLRGKKWKALMGDGTGRVDVEGKSNWVWIRLKYGSSEAPPVTALNRHIPPEHGRVVTVQEIKARGIKGYEVIGLDEGILYYHDETEQQPLPAHGHTHECRQGAIGSDPVNLYTRGWAELRVEPLSPASTYCYVTPGWYLFDVPHYFEGGNTPLFSTTSLGPRYDLVYIDSSGTVGVEEGLPFELAGDDPVPEPPDYTIPLAAVYIETGTFGGVTESMILDCRVMPNVKYPPGGTVFDDSIGVHDVAALNWSGNEDYAARVDHEHRGVRSLREFGESQLFGNITLSQGANIILTQSGQDIEIGFTGTSGGTSQDVSCRVYHNANQSINTAANTYLSFNSEYFDTDSMHNIAVSNNRITFRRDGKYIVGGCVRWSASAAGVRSIWIRLNGTTEIERELRNASSAGDARMEVTTMDEFSTGDYIELGVYQSSGGALNVVYTDRYSPVFWAAKVLG